MLIRLSDPVVQADQRALRDVGKRMKDLGPVVDAYRRYRSATEDLDVAKDMFANSDGADREAMRAEITATETLIAELEEQLKVLLIPRDPNDGRNVIVEIRGAEGGEEGNLWARDLYEMYHRYADRMGWRLEVLAADPSPTGGYNEVSFVLAGEGVWTRMPRPCSLDFC